MVATDAVPAGSTPPADLLALVTSPSGWSLGRAKPMADQIEDTRSRLEAAAVPLSEVEPGGVVRQGDRFRFEGKRTRIIADGLKPLGIKVQGRMSADEANVWIGAMVLALSDLPFAFLKRGIMDALHVPFRFLNEIEGVIRERAALAEGRHRHAMRRLREFERSLRPVEKALPSPERDLTQDEINALDRTFLNMGLKAGFITKEQFDIAIAEAEKRSGNETD